MDEFTGDGHTLQYWCVQKAVKYARKAEYKDGKPAADVVLIDSIDKLSDKLNAIEEKETLVFLELWFNWDTYKIFKVLSKKGIRYFSVDWYANQPRTDRSRKLMNNLLNLDLRNIYRAAVHLLNQKSFLRYAGMINISEAPLLFIPGQRLGMSSPGKEIVPINHHDYEKVLTEDNDNTLNVEELGNYAVFLDVDLPGHPDFKRIGTETISPDVYYRKVNSFFSAVEEAFNVKVVIAAHPKSSYTNEFKHRLCLKNKTRELVKHCSFVLLHHSFSINYAVLYNKPAILFHTNEFIAARGKTFFLRNIYEIMKGYSVMLNVPIINIDEPVDVKQQLYPVDEERYGSFKSNYIVSGKEGVRNYDILKQAIRHRFNVTV